MRSALDLEARLAGIDGRGYKAYGSLAGSYDLGRMLLHLDHIQGDPFAPPSRVRVRFPAAAAGLPGWTREHRVRRVALEDYLTRQLDRALVSLQGQQGGGSGKSGLMAVDRPGQEIMQRTSMVVTDEWVEARLVVGLPARGRRIMGRAARRMLLDLLPPAVESSLRFDALDADDLRRHLETAEDQDSLRGQLDREGMVAFVAEGSVLPRESGVSDRPLRGPGVVPLEVDDDLAATLHTPNRGPVRGFGIKQGVTLVVGGGYHGKSTLLRALARGIYDHVPGDGRHLVVTDPTAVKIRAEDGRRVQRVDISAFITGLPGGVDTSLFCSDSASGSTSQAANIVEALELGARCLLIDEDTSATNFMIRDARMQALVARDREPITPFIDRARELYERLGVSTVLVLGGSGDYLDVADTVIMMDEYRPRDVTACARDVSARLPTGRRPERPQPLAAPRPRHPVPGSLDPRRRGRTRIRARGVDEIQFGALDIDLSAVEQIVHPSQTRAMGEIIRHMAARHLGGGESLADALAACMDEIERQGLDILSPHDGHPGDYAGVRALEVGAAINRLRALEVRVGSGEERDRWRSGWR